MLAEMNFCVYRKTDREWQEGEEIMGDGRNISGEIMGDGMNIS